MKYSLAGIKGEVVSENFSLAGTSLLLPQKLDRGVELTLSILMPGSMRETIIYGQVAWQKKCDAAGKNGYFTGINFIKADPLDIENIINLIIRNNSV